MSKKCQHAANSPVGIFTQLLSIAAGVDNRTHFTLCGVPRRALVYAALAAVRQEMSEFAVENLRWLDSQISIICDEDCRPAHQDIDFCLGSQIQDVTAYARKRAIQRMMGKPSEQAAEIFRSELDKAQAQAAKFDWTKDKILELLHGNIPPRADCSAISVSEEFQQKFEESLENAIGNAVPQLLEVLEQRMAKAFVADRIATYRTLAEEVRSLAKQLAGEEAIIQSIEKYKEQKEAAIAAVEAAASAEQAKAEAAMAAIAAVEQPHSKRYRVAA